MKFTTGTRASPLLARIGIIVSILLVVSAMVPDGTHESTVDIAAAAQVQCATPSRPEIRGWERGSTISYDLSGLANQAQITAAIRAINIMQAAVNSRGMNITFTTDPSDLKLRFFSKPTVIHEEAEVAGRADVRAIRRTGIVRGADILITENTSMFNPAIEDTYFDGLVALFLHELGHTFGLDDTNENCGASTVSIMNHMCVVNNGDGSMPTSVNGCDAQSIVDSQDAWPRVEGLEEGIRDESPTRVCVPIWLVVHYYYDGFYRFTRYLRIVDYQCTEL